MAGGTVRSAGGGVDPALKAGAFASVDDDDSEAVTDLIDEGNDRGFGGAVGANRHVHPHDHSKVETIPAATPMNYGYEPGKNPVYGSRGQDGSPVRGTYAKARNR